jgi:hypothetical protein
MPAVRRVRQVRLYYGHVLCHAQRQDDSVRKGADVKARKAKRLEQYGAGYPAEQDIERHSPGKA